MHAPTGDVGLTVDGDPTVFVGGDPASGAGTDTGLDGRETYTLSFDGAPHPKQGYHVKLTVATPRSNGNDTKTKVFWVEPCDDDDPRHRRPTRTTDRDGTSGRRRTTRTSDTDTHATRAPAAAPSRDQLGHRQHLDVLGDAGHHRHATAPRSPRPQADGADADVPTAVDAGENGALATGCARRSRSWSSPSARCSRRQPS